MHTGALKKWALALTFYLALHTAALRAQIFTNDLPLQAVTTGTNPVDFEFRADGTLIALGNSGVGSLLSGDQGAGTRMLWFPSLSAFRAGTVTGTDWDASNIGQFSFAGGQDNLTSGSNATAFGWGESATNNGSVAMGLGNTSSGYGAFASGRFSTASGQGSLAIGNGNTASGYGSVALGSSNSATYSNAIALGSSNWAPGSCAVALGNSNIARGNYTTASGSYTTASAYLSFVLGTYNVGGGDQLDWVATDPLFEIGNGTSSTPSDALVVYKNGSAAFQGPVTVAPGGDIPMYTGE